MRTKPDGKFAEGSRDRPKPTAARHRHQQPLGLSSIDCRMLVSGGDDQQVLVWDTQTWKARALRASILNRSAASIRAVALRD